MNLRGPAPVTGLVQRFGESLLRHVRPEHLLALDACLGCRQCGTACVWSLEMREERFHPLYRKEFIRRQFRKLATWQGRLARRLGVSAAPDEPELRRCMELFWKCALCGRCTLACPLGLSNVSIFRLARTAYAECGMTRENATRRSIIENTREHEHSFGVPAPRTLTRLAEHLSLERTDVPLDRQGARYLLVAPTVDAVRFPEHLFRLFQLLNAANLDYTLSSRVTDLGTEIEHTVGDHQLSVHMLHQVEAEASRLGVRALIVPECGCDTRTFYVEAPRILRRAFCVPVRSLDSLLLESIRSGRLPVQRTTTPVTLHDPCQVTRMAGMGPLIRELAHAVASDLREMEPHGVLNYCCNGASGLLRLPENTPDRRRVSAIKARQIERTRAEQVISPCAVCTLTLNDVCETYGLATPGQRRARMLYELVHSAVSPALCARREQDRLRMPLSMRNRAATAHASTLHRWLAATRPESASHEICVVPARDESALRDGRAPTEVALQHSSLEQCTSGPGTVDVAGDA